MRQTKQTSVYDEEIKNRIFSMGKTHDSLMFDASRNDKYILRKTCCCFLFSSTILALLATKECKIDSLETWFIDKIYEMITTDKFSVIAEVSSLLTKI